MGKYAISSSQVSHKILIFFHLKGTPLEDAGNLCRGKFCIRRWPEKERIKKEI
ncbi:hypothetical protein HMPREF3213_00219 [Heyndrickxia coagulans]|uniref:Uncharacterized protein n=1 Tax=Heyndrickxia coagulans TaxID=1398 RepID=A0A133L2K4_HEYCO|nr:hypothetical protein HMPREF3213_00219 [Heyndrickxia coagulans]